MFFPLHGFWLRVRGSLHRCGSTLSASSLQLLRQRHSSDRARQTLLYTTYVCTSCCRLLIFDICLHTLAHYSGRRYHDVTVLRLGIVIPGYPEVTIFLLHLCCWTGTVSTFAWRFDELYRFSAEQNESIVSELGVFRQRMGFPEYGCECS